MIEIKNLTISRGDRVIIDNFSATIAKGTIAVISGPNGCGKSTLLSCIAGDIPASSGQILINDTAVQDLSLLQQAELRSVLSQHSSHWLSYTVRESLELGQSDEAKSRIDLVLEKLGILDIARQSIVTLSGGQGQRVEIARALIGNRDILLLDEPLAAQDLLGRSRIVEILQELKGEGKTILLVAHAQSGDLAWCDQIIDDLA